MVYFARLFGELQGHHTNQACYKSGIMPPGIPDVKKDHNQDCPFKNQDDNSTGKNTCQASSALAVRLN
jgi:hypothetical protein